jgi:hypothetical protein
MMAVLRCSLTSANESTNGKRRTIPVLRPLQPVLRGQCLSEPGRNASLLARLDVMRHDWEGTDDDAGR